MYRSALRFAVMSITILTANLLTSLLGSYLVTFRNHARPLSFTLIGMAATVVILYPLFAKLEEWVKKLSMRILKKGRSMAGKYLGLAMVFLACVSVLTYFYAKAWYHIDLLKILVSGNIGRYL
jgi:hypothetical protein